MEWRQRAFALGNTSLFYANVVEETESCMAAQCFPRYTRSVLQSFSYSVNLVAETLQNRTRVSRKAWAVMRDSLFLPHLAMQDDRRKARVVVQSDIFMLHPLSLVGSVFGSDIWPIGSRVVKALVGGARRDMSKIT